MDVDVDGVQRSSSGFLSFHRSDPSDEIGCLDLEVGVGVGADDIRRIWFACTPSVAAALHHIRVRLSQA